MNRKSLKDYDGVPIPSSEATNELGNILIFNEMNFDLNEMCCLHVEHLKLLNENQRHVYDQVIHFVNNECGGFFFVYGYGDTGKTFLWKTLTFKLRSEHRIVLNVASSRIASLLLPSSRTAHS